MRGGIEATYDDLDDARGLARLAPAKQARAAMFSARRRAGREEPLTVEPVLSEDELYQFPASAGG